MHCVFCSLAEEKIVLQNDSFYAINDAFPVKPGHMLIITRRHAQNIFELSKEEFATLQDILQQVKSYLEKEYKPDGYNIGANTGSVAGQSIKHFHLHVIPRYYNDPKSCLIKKGIKKLREYYLN